MKSEKRTISNDILLDEVTALLAEGREVVLMTKGQSMLPFIRGSRDSVVLKARADYAVRDIVLARVRPGMYVLHRIQAVDGDKITLKGDGNLYGTESCLRKDISGAVVYIVTPQGRQIKPAEGRLWNALPTIVRRVFLGLYRRLIYNENK